MEQQELRRFAIKGQYGFEDWNRALHQATKPLGSPFLPTHADISGFRFLRRDAFPGDRNAFIDFFQSVHDPAHIVAVTFRTCSSAAAAREVLVDLLSGSMDPKVRVLEEVGIEAGDVGFGGGKAGEGLLYFIRGNVVVQMHHAGPSRPTLGPLARILDRQIVARLTR
jgi:hypothetical protein